MKDYSSLINPRNKASNLTSSDQGQRGGRTGRLVRFIERRRREAEEEAEVSRVEELEPRMSGITVHTHHHHGQDLKVRHIALIHVDPSKAMWSHVKLSMLSFVESC